MLPSLSSATLPVPRGAMTKQCGYDLWLQPSGSCPWTPCSGLIWAEAPPCGASSLGLGRGLWVSLRPGLAPQPLNSSPPDIRRASPSRHRACALPGGHRLYRWPVWPSASGCGPGQQ